MFIRIFTVAMSILIAAPLLVVVPMSFSTSQSFQFPPPDYWFGYYIAYFTDPGWTGPTINSLVIGLATALLTLALVIPAALALVRYNFAGRSFGALLMLLPLTVPHIVVALGYYYYFGALRLTQTYLGVVLAHTCLSVPISYLIVSANLKGFDRNLELAALNLGATPLQAFFQVTFPLLRPGMLTAALFAFVHSFDEAIVALFISGRDAATLPRKMFDSLRMQADPVISVVSTLLLVAVVLGMVLPPLAKAIAKERLKRKIRSGRVPVLAHA
jgi:putative spermidine/putrescine transport system permease protein